LRNITGHDVDPVFETVGADIVAGEPYKMRLDIDSRNLDAIDSPRQTQDCRATPRPEFEYPVTGNSANGGGQQDGIDGRAETVAGLFQSDLPG
jgi:hypothetical protein